MNMQKNAKKSLGNRGFSLVELIVVIAIMAILAAVAVVGVSVYVDKASEAADKQTIMDIEDALVMGAYSGNYAPGTVVGVVAISKENNADCGGNATIEQMMIDAFGTNWAAELKLQSDVFVGMDQAVILDAVREAKQNGSTIFDSVPNSSYYAEGGNTDKLAADVDELATALNTVLAGMGTDGSGASKVSSLWGSDFLGTAEGIDYKNNPQMAANLTVFAAADVISGASQNDKNALVNGWVTGQPQATDDTTLVMTLAMNFAQCTAIKNYVTVANGFEEDQVTEMADHYEYLMENMKKLEDPDDSYVNDFNVYISTFMNATAEYQTQWRNSGMAKTDAEAFIASMSAVNALEDTYVSADKIDVLDSENAFTEFGAADLLDNMVQYSQMTDLPDGDYVITLVIDENGVPTIVPALSRN